MATRSVSSPGAGIVLLALAFAANAQAGALDVSGSGTWAASAPVTAYSAPDAAWSFSFDMSDTITANPVTDLSNFSYSLNGAPVAAAPTQVEFWSAVSGGLFELDFADHSVDFYGAQVLNILSIAPGNYPAQSDIDNSVGDGFANGLGAGAVSIKAIPEASTWTMLLAGFAGLGFLACRSARGAVA